MELFLFNSLIKQFAFNLENYMAFSFDHLERSNSIAVMGILNLSPDSFCSTNRFSNAEDVLHIAEKMIDQGAHILDVGAESTRPGSKNISRMPRMFFPDHSYIACQKAISQTIYGLIFYYAKYCAYFSLNHWGRNFQRYLYA